MMLSRLLNTSHQRWYTMVIATVLTLVVGVIFFVGHSGRAQTVIPLSTCTTISSSGSYQVTADFTGTAIEGVCFRISASNVTLDGNNKTVTVNDASPNWDSRSYIVDIRDQGNTLNWHDITVKNLISNSSIRVLGDTIHNVTFDRLTIREVSNLGGDDVLITNNTIGEGGIQVNGADQLTWRAMRTVIRDNTVTGGLPKVSKLIFIAGGTSHPCPETDAILDHNIITSTHTVEEGGVDAAIRVGCATHIRVTNNTIRSTGLALGIYIRDETDDGVYENNTVITNTKEALRVSAGNNDKTWPSRNTFHNNIFRSEAGYSFFGTSIGSTNVFTDNIFYANGYGPLVYIGGYFGNTFDHNTFYNAAAGGQTLSLMGDNIEGPPADIFTNNIFSYSGTSVFGYDAWRASRYNGGNHNLFYNRGGALSFGSYGNLAAWRTATGDDANSISADPLLADPAGGDFSTPINSPAHNAGSDGTDIGVRQAAVVVPTILTPITTTPPPANCTENWACGSWSECTNSSQTRVCVDINSCGTVATKPSLTTACIAPVITPGVSSNDKPKLTIATPPPTKVVSGQISVVAKASDKNGIAKLKFYIDGRQFSTDTRAPYSRLLETRTLLNGRHIITVKAFDKLGATSTANRVIVVKNPLAVRLANPATRGLVRGKVKVQPSLIHGITGRATVQYSVDQRRFATPSKTPYSVTWDTRKLKNGSHRLTIQVTDTAKKKATHTIYVRVKN